MKPILFLLLASVLVMSVAGCGSSNNDNNNVTITPTASPTPTVTSTPGTPSPTPVQLAMAKSDKQRIISPVVAASDLSAQVNGDSAFAFDLYKALSAQADGNLFYSPYSISLALAMTYAGARGETEQQMADALHFVLSQDSLHQTLNALDQALASRGQGAKGQDEKGFRLNIANAIWGQQDFTFLKTFLDIIAENYGSGLNLLDFMKEPEESRVTINKWVSEKTEGKIPELIQKGQVNEFTRLVLTNAIYFNAAWLNQFEKGNTKDGAFHLLDGSDVSVPMMRQTSGFGYAKGEGYQTLELPYDGSEMSMIILLPEADQFKTIEGQLDEEYVNSIINNLSYKQVNLKMPKFKFKSDYILTNVLAAMGMPIAFSGGADFSGITGSRDLSIGNVIHQAYVSVDESGTEAAAATAVIMPTAIMPSEPIQVTVDRPFVFLIRDIQTGSIVFVGRVMNPGA